MRIAKRLLLLLLLSALSLYILACVALFAAQRSLIYYPQPRSNTSASTLLTLPVANATVHVSTRPRDGGRAVIYFGGNAEDVSRDIPDLASTFPDRAIFGLHYPGYGGSSGTPSQQSIFAAALTLYDHVHADHSNIVIIGRSLGTGVATFVASQRPTNHLVLITPFESLADAAAAQYPIFPVRLLLRDRFESGKYAAQVTAPTTILVAANDEIVPRDSSDRLRAHFTQTKVSYSILPNAGHNTVQDNPAYWSLIGTQ